MFSDAVPKYRLLVFGCQMNKNDAERISRLLSDMGLASTEDETEADVIVMVTCSVRQSAEERIYGKMEDLIDLKKRNPRLLVGVTGCMAGRDRDGAIRKRLAAVDFFFPTAEMGKLSGWIAERWGLPTPVGTPDSSGQAYLDVEPLRPPVDSVGLRDDSDRMRQVLCLLRGSICARTRDKPTGRGHP